jgi:CheY-like chemotaxis protein
VELQILNCLSIYRGPINALASSGRSTPEIPALDARNRPKVVVVEDNSDSAESLRRFLQLCGYQVYVAHSGEEGLAAVKQSHPDVVLCDIGLPDIDGFALAQALRNDPSTAAVRLIAVTAYGTDEDKERSREAGFQFHLVKPVDPKLLLKRLEESTQH